MKQLLLIPAFFLQIGYTLRAQTCSIPIPGVYKSTACTCAPPGGGALVDVDNYSKWLGTTVYAEDFMTADWYNIETPDWQLPLWGSWVNAQPGRKLILSVPMLVDDPAGLDVAKISADLQTGASGA